MRTELNVDLILFTRLKNGDEEAFEELYDKHYRKIYQFAKSFLKNKEQSEEILQETFLSFWVKRDKFDVDLPVEPLLFTICRRLVLDAFRKSAILSKHHLNLSKMISEANNETEDKIIFSDLLRVTESAIAELPKQQQLVFRLSKYDGLSYEEIAAQLNISKNTVKNHLVVALKTLKSQLDKDGMLYVFFLILFDSW